MPYVSNVHFLSFLLVTCARGSLFFLLETGLESTENLEYVGLLQKIKPIDYRNEQNMHLSQGRIYQKRSWKW